MTARRPSSNSSGGGCNYSRRGTFSRASSADSIFEDVSVNARHLFAKLDHEKKGYLDTSCLITAFQSQLNEDQLTDLVHQLDHDGDGQVKVEDFKKCLKKIARRNSEIREVLRANPIAYTRNKDSTSGTSTDSNRSRLTSDDGSSETDEGRQKRKSMRSREDNRQLLLNRLNSETKRQSLPTSVIDSFSASMSPSSSLTEQISVDDSISSLTSQEHIYELYHLLLSDNPSLCRIYETVLVDVIRFIQRTKQVQIRLERQIESERAQHGEAIVHLSEELDQQVQQAEEAAQIREKQLASEEMRAQLEAKTYQLNKLKDRLKLLEEAPDSQEVKKPDADLSEIVNRVENLQQELSQLKCEKARLEDMLASTRTQLAQHRSELLTKRQNSLEKSRELENHASAFVELVKDNSQLKRHLSILEDVNRELCDANDGLCAVLERSTSGAPMKSTLKDVTTVYAALHSHCRQILGDIRNSSYGEPVSLCRDCKPGRQLSVTSESALPAEMIEATIRTDRGTPTRAMQLMGLQKHPIFSTTDGDNMGTFDQGSVITELGNEEAVRIPKQFLSGAPVTMSSTAGRIGQCEDIASRSVNRSTYSGLSSLVDAPDLEMDVDSEARLGIKKADTYLQQHFQASPSHRSRGSRSSQTLPVSGSSADQTPVEQKITSSQIVSSDTETHSLQEDKLRIFRVMLAGDSAVGKTSLLLRFCDSVFANQPVSTIGIDMKMRSIEVDGKSIMLQLWDTAGQERFRSLTASFYRKADGILLVYDCTSEVSLLHVREWMDSIHENAGREIPVAIVGNKLDLREGQEKQGGHYVGYAFGRKVAQELGALFYETSAVTGENVEQCLTELTQLLCAQEDYALRRPQIKLTSITKSQMGKRCCN